MKLYVVVDTKGAGRIVGVFDSRDRAATLTKLCPYYYELHTCPLNRIDPAVLEWVDTAAQREALQALIDSEE